ncbi:WhiB family transcriptional regulator [Streptomyces sp. MBT57]|nr:WhiB family transcriptional regulator [Streptomyces sp. MBT57]
MDNWRTHAACRDEDPDLFFPIGSSGPAVVQAAEAKAVCRGCPVQAQCLEWGLAEDERRALKRRSRRRAKNTAG